MAISGPEIVSLIKRQIEEFGGDLTLVDVGTVVQVEAVPVATPVAPVPTQMAPLGHAVGRGSSAGAEH